MAQTEERVGDGSLVLAPLAAAGTPAPSAASANRMTTPSPAKKASRAARPARKAVVSVPRLAPSLGSALARMIADAPGKITVTSGRRSRAEQQRLYDLYLSGKGALAAKPGTSKHEKGLAGDLSFENDAVRAWAHANAAKYGLTFPIAGEAWHVELAGDKTSSAGEGGGVGGVTAAGEGSALPADATPQQVKDRVAQQYGYLAAFLDMPEVGKILMQAAREDWSDQTLMGALSKTNWWKTTSATARQWDALNKTDHATARAQVDAKMAEIQTSAQKTGLALSPIRVHDLAVNSLKFGWSGQQMTDALLHEGKLDTSGKTPTDALSIKGNLRERAAQYLVRLADSALEKWTLDVVSGRVTQDAFDAYLKEQAKSLHPEAAHAIDSGVTTATYYSPYAQLAADELEVPPDSINFNDPKWSRALYQVDPKTNERKAMSLADWQRTLRTDPVYGFAKTSKAVDQGASFASMLTETFGKVAS